MAEPPIKNLEQVIKQKISRNETIKNIDISNLLAPGENYMSEMMKVDVYLKNKVTEAEKEIHAVAKCVTEFPGNDSENKPEGGPPDDFMPVMFVKEIAFYKDIVPGIQTMLKKRGKSPVDYFPEYYGGRLNLNGSDKADKDAILLLENLHTSGYKNMDRHIGFDLDTAKMVIKDLAHLHAVCVAIKLLEPHLYAEKLQKNFAIKPLPPPPPPGDDHPKGPMGLPAEVYRAILEQDADCRAAIPAFLQLLEEMSKKGMEEMMNKTPREPYATLVHSDMWMNNTMQQVDSRGRAVKNKFVDFQMYGYGNPLKDLQFLLLTSVQLTVLKTKYDYLNRFYHENYVKVLGELGCDVTPFSYEQFLEEIKDAVPDLLLHGSFMLLIVVFGKKGVASKPQEAHLMRENDFDPIAKERFQFFVREAYNRGWLQ